MKTLMIGLLLISSPMVLAGTNLSDAIDKNEVPSEVEEREEEVLNRADVLDHNETPNVLEEREREEEWRENYDEEQADTVKRQNKVRE